MESSTSEFFALSKLSGGSAPTLTIHGLKVLIKFSILALTSTGHRVLGFLRDSVRLINRAEGLSTGSLAMPAPGAVVVRVRHGVNREGGAT
jgi:hypothetical protein